MIVETNEQEIALILRDALDAFARARGNGDDSLAYQYVVARYSWMDGNQREEKIDQVMRRVDLAKRLYRHRSARCVDSAWSNPRIRYTWDIWLIHLHPVVG